jgi:hypothetical protein
MSLWLKVAAITGTASLLGCEPVPVSIVLKLELPWDGASNSVVHVIDCSQSSENASCQANGPTPYEGASSADETGSSGSRPKTGHQVPTTLGTIPDVGISIGGESVLPPIKIVLAGVTPPPPVDRDKLLQELEDKPTIIARTTWAYEDLALSERLFFYALTYPLPYKDNKAKFHSQCVAIMVTLPSNAGFFIDGRLPNTPGHWASDSDTCKPDPKYQSLVIGLPPSRLADPKMPAEEKKAYIYDQLRQYALASEILAAYGRLYIQATAPGPTQR